MLIRQSGALILIGMMALSGCQSMTPQDPLGKAPRTLPAECSWPRDGEASRQQWVRAAVDALEEREYTIRHTETQLGVISAERTTRLPGLGAVDRPWFGGSSLWGSFGHHSGLALGYGVRFGDDPVKVERLSVLVEDLSVSVSRDSSVTDPDGYLIDARSDNREPFCRELRDAISEQLRVGESRS